jgi:hypothetical protein
VAGLAGRVLSRSSRILCWTFYRLGGTHILHGIKMAKYDEVQRAIRDNAVSSPEKARKILSEIYLDILLKRKEKTPQ